MPKKLVSNTACASSKEISSAAPSRNEAAIVDKKVNPVAASTPCNVSLAPDVLSCLAPGVLMAHLTLPRFHVQQTHAAFRLRSKSAGDR
jgi:hypothetical protein